MDQIVSDFNSLLLDLCRNVAHVCPDSMIGTNIEHIERAITKAYGDERKKFIEVFVCRILKYKDKIDAGDESFFLNKSYDDDLKDNQTIASQVFQFKTIWLQLNKDNRSMIIQYMQLLCELSQRYFLMAYPAQGLSQDVYAPPQTK